MITLSNLKTLEVKESWNDYVLLCQEHASKRKRHFQNYSSETLDELVKQNYFDLGAYVILANSEPIAGFGLYEYKNWVFMSRFVTRFATDIPLFYCMSETAIKFKKNGVIMTVNQSNLALKRIFEHRKKYCGTNVFLLLERLHLMKYTWLKDSITYRYTEQWAFYNGNLDPKLMFQ